MTVCEICGFHNHENDDAVCLVLDALQTRWHLQRFGKKTYNFHLQG